jgi:hypothetical protein
MSAFFSFSVARRSLATSFTTKRMLRSSIVASSAVTA